jgi:protein tyrosine phosphatase type 4A
MTSNQKALLNPPALITYSNRKFLIVDAPTDSNIDTYIAEFKKNNITDVVRACDPSYNTQPMEKEGIHVHEMPFADGGTPPENVVDAWIKLTNTVFKTKPDATIGVHCVAGLGRAPVLVALALIELGCNYEEAIEIIRRNRRGAINARQLKFLKHYQPRSKSCVIM